MLRIVVLFVSKFACRVFPFYSSVCIEEQIAVVDSAKAEIDAENKAINDKMNDGNKDEYVEEIARDKLGYVMPGEKVYQDISVND